MKIKKYHKDAKIEDRIGNGFRLFSTEAGMEINPDGTPTFVYHTGIGVDIPHGYIGIVVPCNTISTKSFSFAESAMIIDAGDSSEIKCRFKLNTISIPHMYQTDEPIAQLLIVPVMLNPELDVEEFIDEVKPEITEDEHK